MSDTLHEILEPLMGVDYDDLLAIGRYVEDEFSDGNGPAVNKMLKRFVEEVRKYEN